MASIESVRASIDANIKTNGRQEITGVVMNAVLNNMVDLSEKNEGTLEEQKTLLNEQSRQIDSLEQKKANQDGKYPELTAGFANNLVGRGEAVDATINFRPSGGTSIEDGAARVKELKGNSVVWNQMSTPRGNEYVYGLTFAPKGSAVTVKGTLDTTLEWDQVAITQVMHFKRDGRKYLIDLVGRGLKPFGIMGYGTNNQQGFIWSANEAGEWAAAIGIHITLGENIDMEANVLVVDLTQMFGAGNEPTTIEEFYNRIPQNVDLFAYNEGEIVSTNAEGIKSVGFNAWDEEWEQGMYDSANGNKIPNDSTIRNKNKIKVIEGQQYYFKSGWCQVFFYDMNNLFAGSTETSENGGLISIPQNARYMAFRTSSNYGMVYKNDICINLSHSGYRNGEYQPYMQFIRDIDPRIREAFPNGMKSAEFAHDKVYNKNGKGIIEKRIGVVDMGTLSWGISAGASHSFYVANFATLYGALVSGNILSTKYVRGVAYSDAHSNLNASIDENANLYVRNDAYSDATTFKSAMNGVMFYYELAEPIITEYDEPFNLDYEVWDFGTEQMLSTKPSAPIKASIVYGFNAVDSVRTAQLEIAELKTQIAQMQAIMASMTAQSAMIKE